MPPPPEWRPFTSPSATPIETKSNHSGRIRTSQFWRLTQPKASFISMIKPAAPLPLRGIWIHVTGTNGDIIDTDSEDALRYPGGDPRAAQQALETQVALRDIPLGDRIISFVQAFLPTHHFEIPSLTPESWKRSVRRFKPQAARGADGYHKLDLLKDAGRLCDCTCQN